MSKLSRSEALEEISNWSLDDVLALLRKNGLEDCCHAVSKRQVDGDGLIHLTEGKLTLWKSDLTRPLIWSLWRFIEDVNKNPEKYIPLKNSSADHDDAVNDSDFWDTDFEDEPEDYNDGTIPGKYSRLEHKTFMQEIDTTKSPEMFKNSDEQASTQVDGKQHDAKLPRTEDENIYGNYDTITESAQEPKSEPKPPKFPPKNLTKLHSLNKTVVKNSSFRNNVNSFQNNDADAKAQTDAKQHYAKLAETEDTYADHDTSPEPTSEPEVEPETRKFPQKNLSKLHSLNETVLKKSNLRNRQEGFQNNGKHGRTQIDGKQHDVVFSEPEEKNMYSNFDTQTEPTPELELEPKPPKFPQKNLSKLYSLNEPAQKPDFRNNPKVNRNNAESNKFTVDLVGKLQEHLRLKAEKSMNSTSDPEISWNNVETMRLKQQQGSSLHKPEKTAAISKSNFEQPNSMRNIQKQEACTSGTKTMPGPSVPETKPDVMNKVQNRKLGLIKKESAPGPPVLKTNPNFTNDIQKQESILSQNELDQGPPVPKMKPNFVNKTQNQRFGLAENQSAPGPPVPKTKPDFMQEIQKKKSNLQQKKTMPSLPVQKNFTKPDYMTENKEQFSEVLEQITPVRPPASKNVTNPNSGEKKQDKSGLSEKKALLGLLEVRSNAKPDPSESQKLPQSGKKNLPGLINPTIFKKPESSEIQTQKLKKRPLPNPPDPNRSLKKSPVADRRDMELPKPPPFDPSVNLPTRAAYSDDDYESFDEQIIHNNQQTMIKRFSSEQSLTNGRKGSMVSVYQPPSSSSYEEENSEKDEPTYESITEHGETTATHGAYKSTEQHRNWPYDRSTAHRSIDIPEKPFHGSNQSFSQWSLGDRQISSPETGGQSPDIYGVPDDDGSYLCPIEPEANLPRRPPKPPSKSTTPSPTPSLTRSYKQNVCGQLMNGLGGRLADEVADMIVSIKRGLLRCCYSQPPEPPGMSTLVGDLKRPVSLNTAARRQASLSECLTQAALTQARLNLAKRSPDKKPPTLQHSNSITNSAAERANRPLPPPPPHINSDRQIDVPDRKADRLSYTDKPWFHNVTREQATILIGTTPPDCYNIPDGYFLFRPSSANPNNPLTLVLWYNDRVYNVPVRKRDDNRFALGSPKASEQSFTTVDEIVSFYRKEKLVLYSGGVSTGSTKLQDCVQK